MCKYVIVITVIARQDVDGHFGTGACILRNTE